MNDEQNLDYAAEVALAAISQSARETRTVEMPYSDALAVCLGAESHPDCEAGQEPGVETYWGYTDSGAWQVRLVKEEV